MGSLRAHHLHEQTRVRIHVGLAREHVESGIPIIRGKLLIRVGANSVSDSDNTHGHWLTAASDGAV